MGATFHIMLAVHSRSIKGRFGTPLRYVSSLDLPVAPLLLAGCLRFPTGGLLLSVATSV
jgi:hypothetical protein